MPDEPPFNPLDKRNLGVSVAQALLAQPVLPLAILAPFTGAGIYVIYYVNTYANVGRRNARSPIVCVARTNGQR